jgi:hypothetical protein
MTYQEEATTERASDLPWSSQGAGVRLAATSRHWDIRTAGKSVGHRRMQAAAPGVAGDKGSATWHQQWRLVRRKVERTTYGNEHPYKAESDSYCRVRSGWGNSPLGRLGTPNPARGDLGPPIQMEGDFWAREGKRRWTSSYGRLSWQSSGLDRRSARESERPSAS